MVKLLIKAERTFTFYKWRYGPATFYGLVSDCSLLTLPFASGIIDDLFVKTKVFGVSPG